ncbi:MAG: hypothetical protein JWP58_2716 [Hymenobacter sp.]|nr:hypothetical protein [Hymenobacter sp.]
MPKLSSRVTICTYHGRPNSRANSPVGGPEMDTAVPPGFRIRSDFSRVLGSWLFSTTS